MATNWFELRSPNPGETLGAGFSDVLFFTRRTGSMTLFVSSGATLETTGTEEELDNIVAKLGSKKNLDNAWE